MEIVYVVTILAGLWYFGGAITAMVQGSASIAEKEFKSFSREQDIRLHKTRAKQTAQVKKLSDLEVLSDREFDAFFNFITKDIDKE